MAAENSPVFDANFATTSDGARLCYHSIGKGPGILIIHGAACYGMSHRELAILLADTYTVHLLSRRNRGLSGNYPKWILDMKAVAPLPAQRTGRDGPQTPEGGTDAKTYNENFRRAVLETDLTDIDLVLEKTGSVFMLGVSVGGILALAASLERTTLPSFSNVRKMVVSEPPLQFLDVDTGLDVKGARRYEDEMKAGDLAGAMITAMNLVQIGPGWIPRPIMRIVANLMIRSQNKSAEEVLRDGKTTMAELAPALRYDFAIVEQMVSKSFRFGAAENSINILLLDGSNSPAYGKIVTDRLESVLREAQRVTILGVGHELLCNQDFRGKPAKAVETIKKFFV